jgi:hypothetical protein
MTAPPGDNASNWLHSKLLILHGQAGIAFLVLICILAALVRTNPPRGIPTAHQLQGAKTP